MKVYKSVFVGLMVLAAMVLVSCANQVVNPVPVYLDDTFINVLDTTEMEIRIYQMDGAGTYYTEDGVAATVQSAGSDLFTVTADGNTYFNTKYLSDIPIGIGTNYFTYTITYTVPDPDVTVEYTLRFVDADAAVDANGNGNPADDDDIVDNVVCYTYHGDFWWNISLIINEMISTDYTKIGF